VSDTLAVVGAAVRYAGPLVSPYVELSVPLGDNGFERRGTYHGFAWHNTFNVTLGASFAR